MLFVEIEKKLKEKGYEQKLKYPKNSKLELSHVFDENLSVKENRKMIEEYNKKIEEEREKYGEEEKRLREEFYSDIVSALMEEYSFSKEVANIIAKVIINGSYSSKAELLKLLIG